LWARAARQWLYELGVDAHDDSLRRHHLDAI
jgi:hypothetical protein